MNKIIAIPTEGEMVNAHFGRSQAFTIFSIETGKLTGSEVLDTKGYEHQHAGIAQLLKAKKVEVVLCGGIGPGAIAGLENAGLEVLRGASGLAQEAAQAYADGTFIATTAICNHDHGHDHGHNHHGHHHEDQHGHHNHGHSHDKEHNHNH